MNDGMLYTIGELARLTGLTVKAIRFYADRGIVPPTDRSPAGYRRYDADALARLELVRTLRALGLDLHTIRRVVEQEVSLREIAAAHADALAAQIRLLRLRQAVLTTVARRGSTPEETNLMHRLAELTEDERRRLIEEFLDSTFGGLGTGHEFGAAMGTMTPRLPEDPEPAQVEAWVELAEQTSDAAFRAGLRLLAEHHAAERSRNADAGVRPDLGAVIQELVGAAVRTGIDPTSPQAAPVVAEVVERWARAFGIDDADGTGGTDVRGELLRWLEAVNDPRRERYLQLLATINGWSAPDSLAPVFGWLDQALRAPTTATSTRT
ncbi:DNA-binding transcriptional regulator, MerR family [Actinopolymorpha cephalotaxi]|uniref:DNA-binding transcriptional MerR regulator n=1 Tax=Actinopolymorpha cephalotaxi TaxID=504797 RepID=A0A1I2LC09_9ACTN|nr:MerR family transcriptional regulator [Actinopolymorpha cephalotaxi]NYH84997.1 DNA-binding transcriptional MerR regulator [Actinopolymorpha cephalotaxi]SFF76058.1 DNA-binding transcriptional regulator, MerR family [Actinopolymorpha cephalotaxi]